MNRPAANLVIRPEKIGDLVVATPAIRAIKTTFPNVPLHVLTDEISAELLRHDPHVDRLIAVPWRGPRRGERPSWRTIGEQLAGTRYERAAILYPNCEGWNFLCARLRIPQVAQLGGTWSSWIFHHRRVMRGHYRNPHHYSEYYLEVARQVGAAMPADSLPHLYVQPDERAALRTRFPAYFQESPRIVIHPFGLTTRFNLGLEAYQKLAVGLSERFGVKVYLMGTRQERPQVKAFPADRVDNAFLDGLTLREVMGVLSLADIVIGGSSGIVHIAAALGVATIGLFCPSYNHHLVWGPRGPLAETLTVDPTVCKCLKHSVETCANRKFCDISFGISVARIADRVEARLTQSEKRRLD